MIYDVVIPTVGRESLRRLLAALASGEGEMPDRVIVVDDRPMGSAPLALSPPQAIAARLEVLIGGGHGPAAARNVGWHASSAHWIAFLDDDVITPPGWRAALAADIRQTAGAAASQGRIHVPVGTARRRLTDWERSVQGLERANWATADIAFRRDALVAAGGFDERFPRAYREDSDLGLRVIARGGWIVRGRRWVEHPVPRAVWWNSIQLQRGNADDALMLALHGPGWERRAGSYRGTRRRHLLTAGLLSLAAAAALAGRPKIATVSGAGWLALTATFAAQRIKKGSKDPRHVMATAATSVAIPLAAAYWWVAGLTRAMRVARRPQAVLVDRDGTVIEDVPYNGEPSRVKLLPGARAAFDRLRRAGIPVAMISNQSGVARGLISTEQVASVNSRVEELLGPVAGWFVCVHGPDDACECRKPGSGLVLEAARRLGVNPARCAVIGDIEADMLAAKRVGARAILVPNLATRPDEVMRAPETAATLDQAVSRLLGPAR